MAPGQPDASPALSLAVPCRDRGLLLGAFPVSFALATFLVAPHASHPTHTPRASSSVS